MVLGKSLKFLCTSVKCRDKCLSVIWILDILRIVCLYSTLKIESTTNCAICYYWYWNNSCSQAWSKACCLLTDLHFYMQWKWEGVAIISLPSFYKFYGSCSTPRNSACCICYTFNYKASEILNIPFYSFLLQCHDSTAFMASFWWLHLPSASFFLSLSRFLSNLSWMYDLPFIN